MAKGHVVYIYAKLPQPQKFQGLRRLGFSSQLIGSPDFMKQGKYAERIGAGAPVYLAAVFEYLAADVLEFTENTSIQGEEEEQSQII